jgi:hypothetical protein
MTGDDRLVRAQVTVLVQPLSEGLQASHEAVVQHTEMTGGIAGGADDFTSI